MCHKSMCAHELLHLLWATLAHFSISSRLPVIIHRFSLSLKGAKLCFKIIDEMFKIMKLHYYVNAKKAGLNSLITGIHT